MKSSRIFAFTLLILSSGCSNSNNLDSEASKLAESRFSSIWLQCGDTWVSFDPRKNVTISWGRENLKFPNGHIIQIKNVRISVHKFEISDIEKMNGFEYNAVFQLSADYEREADKEKISSWTPALELSELDDYVSKVGAERKMGRWRLYDPNSGNDLPPPRYEKPNFTCSELPQ